MDTTQTITHLSLCAGYGGIDLGLRSVLPSMRAIAYVEIEAFPCANLVAKMQEGWLDAAPIWTNLKTFDARPFRGLVDILSGGFPCQPFSHAGQRKGTEDPRHLFPEIERIIRECEPKMLFLENVEGIISSKYGGTEQSVLHHVLGRLESMGYRAEAGLFSAEECLYPHRRKRVFIGGISNAQEQRLQGSNEEVGGDSPEICFWDSESARDDSGEGELADTRRNECGGRSTVGEVQETDGGETSQSQGGREGGEDNTRERTECQPRDECAEVADTEGSGTRKNDGGLRKRSSGISGGEGSVAKLGDTASNGCDKGQSDKNRRRKERGAEEGRVQESEGGCSQVDDTCCEGLEGSTGQECYEEQTARLAGSNRGDQAIPSRPGEPQHFWEAPRTVGDEEVITAMGGSTYGSADGNVVRNQRIDSLRALGNGVVPATAARAFITLMDRLVGRFR